MKYAVFALAVAGVPFLAAVFAVNARWMRHAFWGVAAGLCLYQKTALNFFSHENYRGSARGMETSVVHLLCAAILLSLAMRHRIRKLVPEAGFAIYALYVLLCLPSFWSAESALYSWLELWKMLLLPVVGLAVFWFLDATKDVEAPVLCFASVAVANAFAVLAQHFSGVYQPAGLFPHRNSMAMAMGLVAPLFFAAYIERGARSAFGRVCVLAFFCAAFGALRSYSRGAIAVLPLGCGTTALACLSERRNRGAKLRRIAPIAVLAAIGAAAMVPRIIERFETAPEASANTRVELALCAWEMIKDEPLRGVGMNNWGVKINPPWDYAELAGRNTHRGEDFEDGIVETVYLLVAAECGLPALAAMLLWFAWHWFSCLRLLGVLGGTEWRFVPAGLLGGLASNYLQSALEWVLRQQMNLIFLAIAFGMVSFLNARGRALAGGRIKRRTART